LNSEIPHRLRLLEAFYLYYQADLILLMAKNQLLASLLSHRSFSISRVCHIKAILGVNIEANLQYTMHRVLLSDFCLVSLLCLEYLGSGIIIATAFVHLLSPAFEELNDPSLPEAWQKYDWAAVLAMGAVFLICT
jgi:hypothetical protein